MDNNEIKSITIADNEKFLRQKSAIVDIKNDMDLNKNIKVLDKFCKANDVMAMVAITAIAPTLKSAFDLVSRLFNIFGFFY